MDETIKKKNTHKTRQTNQLAHVTFQSRLDGFFSCSNSRRARRRNGSSDTSKRDAKEIPRTSLNKRCGLNTPLPLFPIQTSPALLAVKIDTAFLIPAFGCVSIPWASIASADHLIPPKYITSPPPPMMNDKNNKVPPA